MVRIDAGRCAHTLCALASIVGVVCTTPVVRAAEMGGTVRQTRLAGPYRLGLHIGALEKMYTPAEAAREHPATGEVMLSGTMAMGMGMGDPMPNHHLEVHVYTRATGATVTRATVSIAVLTLRGTLLQRIPIAVMRGVHDDASDTHFGNNVALKDGRYLIAVDVNRTKATFAVTLGGGMRM